MGIIIKTKDGVNTTVDSVGIMDSTIKRIEDLLELLKAVPVESLKHAHWILGDTKFRTTISDDDLNKLRNTYGKGNPVAEIDISTLRERDRERAAEITKEYKFYSTTYKVFCKIDYLMSIGDYGEVYKELHAMA